MLGSPWLRIRALTEHHNIPLQKLAFLSGINRSRIYSVSGGRGSLTIDEAVSISKIFPQHALWILTGGEISLKIRQETPVFLAAFKESDPDDVGVPQT